LAKQLAGLGVRATFFFVGNRLHAHPDALTEIIALGHTVGNHTWSHPAGYFWCAPRTSVAGEIDHANAAMAAGGAVTQFRAPAGIKSVFLRSHLAQRGMRLIAWSVRGFDGIRCEPAAVIQRIIPRLFPGAIILMHEGKRSATAAQTSIECIMRLVEEIRGAGYDFVIPDDTDLC
jgi:peptidoglycan/xylan/chitin deacetylase (PgdA/CDA1 family)